MAQRNQIMNMKNKDEDSEKTAFERFEQELKQTIFGILFLVLKDEESGFLKTIIFIIIGEIQILTVIFSRDINYPWKNDDFADYFKGFFHIFTFSYWCSLLNLSLYIMIFYFGIAILVFMVANIIYASYLFSSKQITVLWPYAILRGMIGLCFTIFFYPLIGDFIDRKSVV